MKELLELEYKEAIGKVDVLQEGSCSGYSWTITWKTVGGDKVPLEVPENALIGFDIDIKLDTIQDGGITIGPLTGEFLQLMKDKPQVRHRYNF